jgi:serine/threonine protein kinase
MADPHPQKIGKYDVRETLGEGGFGRVYKAFDPTVGRLVAVKVLTTQGSPDMLARFQNEANSAGNLHHENIVTIYEFGEYNGAPFIAMEYLEGLDLNQIMSGSQPPSLLDKVRIMTQVGQGLQCAHQSGVVHRDVKPANIKVQPNGLVKIMDFGIARLTRDDGTRLTQKGDLVGTIRYMSPEQFSGLDVDSLCDIFAYGVIYYELVSGQHPFEAPDVAAFMYRITGAEPVPLNDLVPECPAALNQIVMKAIEKDRDLRYQTLEDLLLDTRPLLLDLQKERASELLAQTREMFEAGHLTQAQASIREVIELDTASQEAWEMRDRIQKTANRRSLRPKVETLLKSAESDLGGHRFQEAIESLEAACKLDPTDTGIGARLQEARQQWEGARQAARLLSDATREFDRQNLTLAERLASQALGMDPKNAMASDLVGAIRRDLWQRDNARRLKQALDNARRLAAVEDFDSAIEALLSLKDTSDPAGEVRALLGRIRDQKFENARQERLRSEKQALRGILRESRLQDALPRLEALCAEFPEDADLATLLADTSQQLHAQQRSEDVRQASEEVARLRASAQFAEAEATLRRLSSSYPGDSEIQFLLQDATRAHEDHERREKVAEVIRQAEGRAADFRYEEARQVLDAAVREYGDETTVLEARRKLESEASAHRRVERARQMVAAARSRISEGQYDSAIGLLKQATAEDPQNREIEELVREARRQSGRQRASRAIDQACADARASADGHEYEAALEALRKALQANPGDRRLEGLLEDIASQQKDWESEQQLRDVLRGCSQLLRERRFPEAIRELDAQLTEQPREPALLKQREQAQAEWESAKRSEALARATAEVRAALEQGRLDEAALLLEHYAGEFGAEADFLALDSTARKAQRAKQIQDALRSVSSLASDQHWEAALKVCQAAMVEYPDAPELAEIAASLQQQNIREQRQTEAARLVVQARQAIAAKDWGAGVQHVEALGRQFPEEPALPDLRESLQRERRRSESERILCEVEDAIRRGDWATAEQRLAAAAGAGADSARSVEMRRRIDRGKARDRAVAQAATAVRKGHFGEAEKLLGPMVAADPADAEASDLLRQAQTQRAAAEAEQAIGQGRKDAKALAKERQFDAAVRLLSDLIRRYGSQPDVERDIEQISAAAERQRAVLRLEERRKAGDAQSVLDEATRLLSAGDVAEARPHLEWAQNTLRARASPPPMPATVPAPVPEQAPPPMPPKPPSRKLIWVGISCAAILASSVGIYLVTGKTRPPAVKDPSVTAVVTPQGGGPTTPRETEIKPPPGDAGKTAVVVPTEKPHASGPTPDEFAARVQKLVARNNWTDAAKLLAEGGARPGFRQTPQLRELAARVQAHDDNAKLLAAARTDLQAGNLQGAESAAQRLSQSEFQAEARAVSKDVKSRVEGLATRVSTQIGRKNAAQARQSLSAAQTAYPADARWKEMDARIRELESPVAPPPPPPEKSSCPPASSPEPPSQGEGPYESAPTRTFNWSGNLARGCVLALKGSWFSAGNFNYSIPRVPASVSVASRPPGVEVTAQPTALNGFKIELKNNSSATVQSIRIDWRDNRH